ncbi:PREDICTED: protein AHNAK2 [Odobenus rosmarus divergens]|uniref:Protein AHNAK2 n=1 Tax=Odobenus rosmarus divergens TaxID=9708 RepID=A0A9B0GA71_ODORO
MAVTFRVQPGEARLLIWAPPVPCILGPGSQAPSLRRLRVSLTPPPISEGWAECEVGGPRQRKPAEAERCARRLPGRPRAGAETRDRTRRAAAGPHRPAAAMCDCFHMVLPAWPGAPGSGAGAALPHQGELSLQPKVSTAGAGSKEEAAEAILGRAPSKVRGAFCRESGRSSRVGPATLSGPQSPQPAAASLILAWVQPSHHHLPRAGPDPSLPWNPRLASSAVRACSNLLERLRLAAEFWARPSVQDGVMCAPARYTDGLRLGPAPRIRRLVSRLHGSADSASLFAVSGRQLQPEEPDADTEEDHSVTEGPADEIIRPRPQGSSPVYEYAAEGASSGLPEDTPRRRASSGSGGRRSWWKRDSGDSRTFSRMSCPQSMQEATEVTLMTEAEAGASGYSVTGGGDQGIFVKQVLKDSSAAKLFSLKEGDQLLSATIFFDNIKYEDALKILQYSEPYKVQFQVKRKRPATEDEEGAARGAQDGPKGSEKQDKDVADGSTETPTQILEGGGDQERLLAKPREGRRRRPQKERLSWPKFQSITSKHMPGPRRSHSSSEAYGRGDAPDVSPTSTDTEAQLPAEDQEQKAGPDGQRRRRFLNLRFRMGSGKGPTLEGRPSREVQGGALQAGVVEEAGSCEDRREAPEATVQSRGEDGMAEVPAGTPIEPGAPSRGALGEGASVASRRRKETKEVKDPEDAVSEGKPGVSSAPQGREGLGEVAQGMEIGIAGSALQGKGDAQGHQPEFQIQIPSLKTPVFKFSKERKQDTEGGTAPLVQEDGQGGTAAQETRPAGEGVPGPQLAAPQKPKAHLPEQEEGGAGGAEEGHRGRGKKDGDKDRGGREERWTVLKFNMPSFTWSPRKDARAAAEKPVLASDQETGSTVTVRSLQAEDKEILEEKEEERDTRGGQPPGPEEQRLELERKQGDLSLGDQEVAATDSKFKMPKFKMPSFGASAPSKDLGTSVDVSVPRVRAEATLPSLGGEVRAPEGAVQVPTADIDLPGGELEVSLPEGEVAVSGLEGKAEGVKIKGQLPKVQMPSLKMAKEDIKAPQVDIKGPKVDLKGAKGEVSVPDMEVLLPTVEVDAQVPGAKVEAALSLGDKEVAARDSKFKMPKFKMPSFSMSVPSKDLGTSVDVEVSVPKVRAEATQPSLGREVRAPEGAIQVPTADIDLPGEELEVSVPEGEVAVTGPKGKAEGVKIKGQLPKVQMPSLKMPKVDIKAPQVDIKGPKLDLKGTKGEVSAPDMEVSLPSVEVDTQVSGAKVEADLSLEVKDVAARDSKFKMPKFKMPSFGTSAPSKSLEASVDVSLPKVQAEVSMPSIQADIKTSDVTIELPSADLDVKTASVGLKLPEGQEPEGKLQEPSASAGLKGHLPKVQMPSIKMPKVDIKAPQVDIKGPKLDLKGVKGEVSAPDGEVSLPSMEVDSQVPDAKVEADLSVGEKEVAARDSKFKMPKFKMPSFGASGLSKSLEASVDASLPKVQAEVSMPSIQADVKTSDVTFELPSADLDIKTVSVGLKLPESQDPKGELQERSAAGGLKGHLPKVQMPSIKMPKVDFKDPQMDIKGPKLDLKAAKGEVSAPDMEMSLPTMEVDAQVPEAKLEADLSMGDKEVAARESKFKMPKFKMPSFGVSVPSKDLGTSVDMLVPKVGAEATLPSLGGEVRAPEGAVQVATAVIDLPGGELEVSLPKGEVAVSGLKGKSEGVKIKGQLPKMQMPSLKMPTVDIKAPQVDIKAHQVDIKGPELDLKGAKGEVSVPDMEVFLPSVEVDAQVPGAKVEADLSLRDKEVATRDSKFKMPKFKMPSFGASVPSKSMEASVDASLPKVQAEVSMPSIQADVKTSDVTIELPSAHLEVKTASVGLKLPEEQVPEGERQETSVAGGLKGHLPMVQIPSIKMSKVDFKAPQVDIRGPKLDLKGTKGEVSAPDMEVSLPTVELDAQVPSTKVEADLTLGDKEVASRDSKFKMPKLKMPSFGVSAPSKDLGTSMDVEVSLPKVRAEASLPSLGREVQAPEGAVQLPTADIDLPGEEMEVSLPEGEVAVSGLKDKAEGVKIKAQLPKVQMPSLKMPKVDIKAPQVDIKCPQLDIKGPKLDLKGAKGEVSAPDVEVSLPRVEVDAQMPGAKVEADLSLGDKEVASRDSKFKMPKFKMPSFGASAPSKDLGTCMDVSVPKVGAEATLPSLGGKVQAPEDAVQVATADIDLPGGELEVSLPKGEVAVSGLKGQAEVVKIKGHLPKVHMPSLKIPTVDIKAPQVDIKGPKLDLKGTKGEVSAPEVEVSLPTVEVDAQVPSAKGEAELSMGDKDVAARDSKFKMPKFKMPSFGTSAPSKSLEASVDPSLPKVQAEVSMPSIQADVKTSDVTIELPSADLDVKTASVDLKLPEGQVPEGELQEPSAAGGLKGHLPKGQMPSIKMPKVDIKAPQVDIKGPKLDLKGAKGEVSTPDVEMSLPSVEVDAQVPGSKEEADQSLGDKEVAARDSKFKMPKFKMPSFSTAAPSKDLGISVDVSVPKVGTEATLPSLGGEVRAPERAVQVATADIDLPGGELEVSLPEGVVAVSGLKGKAEGVKIKGQLPKMQMPSLKIPTVDIKVPQVDIKAPQVDIKGPKLDLKGAKGEVSAPDMEVSLPSVEVDAHVPDAKLEADQSLGDKEVAARDSKFKMPKFKIPSFGASVPSESLEVSVDPSLPKVQAEISMPSIQADVKTSEGTFERPSADLDVKTGLVGLKIPEGQVPEGELQEPSAAGRLKGHLPKVQMPSVKMPKVDFKAPQVDIRGPKLDLKGAKGEVSTPDKEASLPAVEVDAQVPSTKGEADLSVGDKEVATRDSKIKMPKFKMPSFGVSVPSKDLGTSMDVDVSLPNDRAEATLPSLGREVRASEGAIQVPTVDIDLPGGELEVSVPEGEVAVTGPKGKAEGVKIKGQLPKVQMPSLKMPKVDIKAPQVDIKGPKLDLKCAKVEVSTPDVEVSLPSMEVDAQVPGAKVEADLSLGDKEVAARDSKFKMPKFKMPSFSSSAPSKDLRTSVDMSGPKVGVEATLPSLGREVLAPEGDVLVPTADIDLPGSELEVSLPEGEVAVSGLKGKAERVNIEGQLPSVQMPSLKMPTVDIRAHKVDIKAPQVDIKGPKLDLKGAKEEVRAPDVEVSLLSLEVDAQVPKAKLEADLSPEDKEVATRDSKFKMPKFKMPSFGASVPRKSVEASVDVSLPKVQAEVSMFSIQADVKTSDMTIELPSADLDIKTASVGRKHPEDQVSEKELKEPSATGRLKGHLPKVQMPSIKMPKVDSKAPQEDIKGPKLDLKGTKGEVSVPDMEMSLPTMEVDVQVPSAKVEADLSVGDKEVATRDSKFKMPKFKMPSFGVSAPSKDLGTSVDVEVSMPSVRAEATLASLGREVQDPEVAVQVPTAGTDLPGEELEVSLPEGEVAVSGLKDKAEGVKIKGQLPKVQLPSLKMPKVDIKAPQVDIKGPKLDLKGAKGEVSASDVEVSLPSVEVDAQVPDAKLEADLYLGDKEVAGRDSKFKMPKFKMPSFGTSGSSKSLEAFVDPSLPKVQAEVSMPSIQTDVKTSDVTIELPSADLDIKTASVGLKLPEGQMSERELQEPLAAGGLRGHLPKVQMPSIKTPKVDFKDPQVDIKGPKLDLKGAKGEVSATNVQASLPTLEVDTQVPGAKVEADLSMGDKEVADRDSKFKMPKFKMPSFGASAPSKDLGTSMDVSLPKVGAKATLPSLGGEMQAPDGAVQRPAADIDLPGGELQVSLPEGEVAVSELKGKAEGVKFKGQLPKAQMPSLKMPKVDIKAPQVDVKAPQVDIKRPKLDLKCTKGEVSSPDTVVSLPRVEVDAQVLGTKVEADLSLGDKEVATRDSKFKMPKFKMPSFGASVPSKDLGTSMDMSVPKVGAEATLPSLGGEVRAPEGAVQAPIADINLPGGELEVSLPEGEVAVSGLKGKEEGVKIKGQLPKVQMPSLKMTKVDIKAPQVDIRFPQVDIKGPKLDLKGTKGEASAPDMDMSLSSMVLDAQVPGAKLEADLFLGDKELAARDSKFKMPKFKMPSFSASGPSKSLEAPVDTSLPKVQAEVSMSSIQADVKTCDMTIELPSANLDVKTGLVGLKIPEGQVPKGECQETSATGRLKGHLPKVQMPSIKMPKVDFKTSQVDIKGPKLDLKGVKGEVSAPEVEVSLPTVEVDAQVPCTKVEADLSMGDKEVATRDSKFKMPSFGMLAPSKGLGTSVDISVPKVRAEATLPSLGGEVRTTESAIQVPTADIDLPGGELEVSPPEGVVAVSRLKGKEEGVKIKGQLPKVQLPSLKMPKVDIKAPQVDIKGPKLDLKGAKGEVSTPDVEVSLPSVEVDVQVSSAKVEADLSVGDKEVAARDSKFKMPKFKMPSFGMSVPSKSLEASVDTSLPKVQAEVSMPSIQADVKSSDVTIELPSADLDIKTASVGLKLLEGQVPEGELQEPSASAGLKGHLPKMQMPSIKMPKVDIKAPQVDIMGPKLDLKGAKGEVSTPDVEVSLPSVEVDAQVSSAKVEADLSVGDKEVAARDSKFKMPKFKMPSFGASAPSKDLGTSVDVDVSVPKAGAETTLPSLGREVRAPEGAIQVPTADTDLPGEELEVSLPEGEVAVSGPKGKADGVKIKGQLPKVQMPSLKMHKVDIKAPQVDIKGPKVDLKGAKGEVSTPDVEVSLPSVEVSAQVSGAKVEAGLSLGDKEVAARDSKFKMPKFKMPSFGASVPSKSVEASVDASLPKVQAEVSMPSIQADVKSSDVTIELPSADLDIKTASVDLKLLVGQVPEDEPQEPLAAAGLKGHLPKVQMPSIKMPKVDSKAPQVDIRGPLLDLKGAKGEVSTPNVEVSLPSVEVDAQVPGTKMEADLSLGDKEVAARDSKFKMPSFGASVPSKSFDASVDVSLPKVQADVSMPSIQADVKTSDVTIELPSAHQDVNTASVGLKLPEGQVPEWELLEPSAAAGLKGHLPKVQMPSIKMPKVDSKAPQVDVKGPKLDLKDAKGEVSAPDVEMSLPTVEVDAQVPVAKLDSSSGEVEVFSKATKFKFPKISISSSRTSPKSGHGGSLGTPVASVETSLQVSRLGWLSGPHGESSCLSPSEGVTLTKYQVTVPRGPVPSELPCETPSGSQLHAQLPSMAGAGDLPSSESILLSQPDGHTSPADTVFPESYGRVTFPKFHRPKFRLSLPTSAAAVVEPGAAERAPPTSPPLAAQGLDSSVEEATAFPVPEGHLPPAGVSASTAAEGQAGTAGTSAVAPEEAPAEGVGRKGKGRPVTAPRLKLPSFSWSPKKGAEPKADPGHSPAVTADALGSPPGGPITPAEAGADVSLGKDGEAGAVRTPALAQMKVAPPGMEASTRGAGLPRGDPVLALAGPTDTASGKGGVGGAGTATGPPEGADVSLHLPEAPVPSAGFVKPDLSPGDATVEGSLSTGHLPLPKHGLSLRDSTQEHGPGDSSASQLCGDMTASSVEDPLQPSPAVGSPERDAAVGEAPAGPRESWFRMPSLRLPSFGRPPKERVDSAGLGAQRPAPVTAGVQGEGEATAGRQSPDACAPASEVDAAKSLQPPEAGADGAAVGSPASSYADVLRRNLDPHAPAGPSASEVRVRPGAGSLPLQLHGVLAEPRGPPGEAGEPPLPGPAGQGLGRRAQGAEGPPSQPEGPVRLRASSTDVPSQVSVVNVGQVWEDSVLRVQFPKLKVPRFSFPAPSLEADIFVPSVRELSSCPQSGPDTALLEQSPGGRGTSIPKAPVALGLSSEAAPICKVRVHIQGAEAASRKVAVHSTVTAGYTELSGPEAFPTQIVQESEVPASETQTPSCGFSLLKGRVPEPPPRARVHLVTAECGLGERLREAQEPIPGADPVSGDLQPDTGEPFEIICPNVDVPGPPACSSDLHSGHGPADSCSDEEPAEILEFLPEEGQEAEEAEAPKAKPEGKRSSGLFRFWLPSIGFSSSASETSADSQADAQRPAPVQTQPEARTPPSQEKGGWFRFPKLGFSSSPTKKSKSEEEEVSLAEQSLQEEAGTFYDARESFSPEETGAGELAEAAGARRGSGTMVTSAARTELILLEQDGAASQQSAPRPATK